MDTTILNNNIISTYKIDTHFEDNIVQPRAIEQFCKKNT